MFSPLIPFARPSLGRTFSKVSSQSIEKLAFSNMLKCNSMAISAIALMKQQELFHLSQSVTDFASIGSDRQLLFKPAQPISVPYYPNTMVQLATVASLTSRWALFSKVLPAEDKEQLLYFVEVLLDEADSAVRGKPKTAIWQLANSLSKATSDRCGVVSTVAGFAHTNDFDKAFTVAEQQTDRDIDIYAYILSWQAIQQSLEEQYLMQAVEQHNFMTVTIKFSTLLNPVLAERNRQFRKFLIKSDRIGEAVLFDKSLAGENEKLEVLKKDVKKELLELDQMESFKSIIEGWVTKGTRKAQQDSSRFEVID